MRSLILILLLLPLISSSQKAKPTKTPVGNINSNNINSNNNNSNSFNTTINYYGADKKTKLEIPKSEVKITEFEDVSLMNIYFDNSVNKESIKVRQINFSIKKIYKIGHLHVGFGSQKVSREKKTMSDYDIFFPLNDSSFSTAIDLSKTLLPNTLDSVRIAIRTENAFFDYDFAIVANLELTYQDKLQKRNETVVFIKTEGTVKAVNLTEEDLIYTDPMYPWMSGTFQNNYYIAAELKKIKGYQSADVKKFTSEFGGEKKNDIKALLKSKITLNNYEAIYYSFFLGKLGRDLLTQLDELEKRITDTSEIKLLREARLHIQSDTISIDRNYMLDSLTYTIGKYYWTHQSDLFTVQQYFGVNLFPYKINHKRYDSLEWPRSDSASLAEQVKMQQEIDRHGTAFRRKMIVYDSLKREGMYQLENQQYALAIMEFKKMESMAKDDGISLDDISAHATGLCYASLNDHDNAIAYYTLCLKTFPYNKTFNNRGWEYYQKNQFTLAIADFTTAIEKYIHDEIPYYNRACAYKRINKTSEAIADLEKCVSINPDAETYYGELATLYEKLKNPEKVKKNRDRFIEISNEKIKANKPTAPAPHIYDFR